MIDTVAYAALSASVPLAPWRYQIREPLQTEIIVEVLFCGICHSDIHAGRAERSTPKFPLVPGHEFTGLVAKLGASVRRWKVGDRVGVGCLVNSCRSCDSCQRDMESYCPKATPTYNGTGPDGKTTYGGYGQFVVVDQDFAFAIPESIPMDRAAPLFCAGITTWSPIRKCDIDQGELKIGVIGLGGLGHMAVQFAAAFENDVYVFSRSIGKKDMAERLGAKQLILSTSDEEMSSHKQSFDFILDTVSAGKDLLPYVNCLKLDGTLVLLGAPPTAELPKLPVMPMLMRRRAVMGSCVGGRDETEEMLLFCEERNILPYVETIKCDQVNDA